MSVLLFSGCASTGSGSGISLLEAIEQSAEKIAGELPKGSRLAIVAFESENANLSDYIMDELTGALFDYGLEVADRQNLEYVYKELKFQMSGAVSDETAQSIGKFLGAELDITGSLTSIGGSYRYRTSAIHVENANNASVTRLTVRNDRETRKMVTALANQRSSVNTAKYSVSENTTPQTAGTFLDRGIMFASRGDYDTAIADYSEAIRLDLNNARAYGNRGYAYIEKGDYDRAIADCTQAIRIDPNYAVAYYNRGVAYRNKEDYDRAIADYTQAIRIDPNNATPYNNRGVAYDSKKEYDRAIADYTQAIRIDPNYAVAYYNRGTAYADKKDHDRAIADYTQAIRIDPNDADAYYNRGVAYYYKGDYDRAIADFETVLRIDPNDAHAKEWLENTRRERGR